MLRIVAVPASLVPKLDAPAQGDLHEAIRMILPVTARRRGILYDANNQKSEDPYPLEQMAVRALLVSSADDLYGTLANARGAAAAIPGARLLELGSGGHLLLGRDAEVWPAVAQFMRE
jgi:2-hydroxy-6-oxonona-2,4-dienedioate hydrolase